MGTEQVTGLGADLAELRIDSHEPSVIVVFGKVGVGKTAVAKEIARRLGSSCLNSDEFRRERFKKAQYEVFQSDIAMWSMLLKAQKLFSGQELSVVFDATFSNKRSRESVRRLAAKNKKRLVWIEVVSDQEVTTSENIDGELVPRRIDEPVEIEQRIVVHNLVGEENPEERVKQLVDQFVIS